VVPGATTDATIVVGAVPIKIVLVFPRDRSFRIVNVKLLAKFPVRFVTRTYPGTNSEGRRFVVDTRESILFTPTNEAFVILAVVFCIVPVPFGGSESEELNCWTLKVVPTPAGPSGPVVPVSPVIPVMPVTPVVPVKPVGPVEPVMPVVPVDPVEPVGPVIPVIPVDPVVPVMPVEPVMPVAPVIPVVPVDPVMPVGPVIPV
jgi:hypothetical protein